MFTLSCHLHTMHNNSNWAVVNSDLTVNLFILLYNFSLQSLVKLPSVYQVFVFLPLLSQSALKANFQKKNLFTALVSTWTQKLGFLCHRAYTRVMLWLCAQNGTAAYSVLNTRNSPILNLGFWLKKCIMCESLWAQCLNPIFTSIAHRCSLLVSKFLKAY